MSRHRRYQITSAIAGMIAVVAFAVVVLGACTGCASSTRDRDAVSAVEVANTTAATIDALQNTAETFYELEQNLSLARSVHDGDAKNAAVARVLAIRAAWSRVWSTLERARMAHRALVVLIESGPQTAELVGAAKAKLDELTTQARAQLAEARARTER